MGKGDDLSSVFPSPLLGLLLRRSCRCDQSRRAGCALGLVAMVGSDSEQHARGGGVVELIRDGARAKVGWKKKGGRVGSETNGEAGHHPLLPRFRVSE